MSKKQVADSGKQGGGEIAIRGFLAQTLVALLEACKPECTELTLEPYTEGNDKFDFCWTHNNGTRYAVQVKSTQNSFTSAMVKTWAAEMKAVRADEQCSLMLVGSIPPAVQKMTKVEGVTITSKNLDLDGMSDQAAHRIAELLEAEGASVGRARWRKMVVKGLVGEFLQRSANQTVARPAFLGLLAEWMGGHLPQSTTLDFDSPKWQLAEQAYRTKLADWFGFTRVLGHPEPISLEGIFTDLYLLDQPLAMRRFSLEDLRASDELHGKSHARNEGLSVAEQHKRLFILGKPGAGKTTFLRYLTWQAAQGNLPWLPIFVGLRDWAESGLELLPFIVKQFEIYDFPDAGLYVQFLLRTGNAILLLDGLDEVNEVHNARLTRAVKDFIRQYDQSPSLITCRVASRDDSFVEQRFKYVEVADFTLAQIESYVRKWFAGEPIKGDKFLADFEQEDGLQELASSPLLLGMLCLAFADSMEFGTRRVDLYEDAIDALLRKWDSSRSITRDGIYKNLNHHLKKRIFAAIAYKRFCADQYLFKESDLAADLAAEIRKLPEIKKPTLDGEEVLKRIEEQHGIFVERAQKIHSFAHLTFQEYFAALAIKGNSEYQRELMLHIHDPRWREVFLLTASLLDNADDFFEKFQRAVVTPLSIEPQLCQLLSWTMNKTESLPHAQSMGGEIRSFYLALHLSRNCTFGFFRPKLTKLTECLFCALEFAQGFISSRTELQSLNRALDITHSVGYSFVNYQNLEFKPIRSRYNGGLRVGDEPTLNRARKLAHISNKLAADYLLWALILVVEDCVLDKMYMKIEDEGARITNSPLMSSDAFLAWQNAKQNFFGQAVTLLQKWGVPELPELFRQIIFPSTSQLNQSIDLTGLAQQLRSKLGNKYGVLWLTLNSKNLNILNDYFDANQLLLDCLAVATVTDREAIRNSLFLPPEESASGG